MKTGIKKILGAVIILAALFSAAGARAEISIGTGITGLMLRPVSVRWQEKAAQAPSQTAAVETSSVSVKAEEQPGQIQSGGGKQESAAAAAKVPAVASIVAASGTAASAGAENKSKEESISGTKVSESKKV